MLKLLSLIQQWTKFSGLSIRELASFAKEFASFDAPPDVNDESALRAWLGKVISLLEKVSAETPTELDDGSVALVKSLMVNDRVWGLTYKAIVLVFGKSENMLLMSCDDFQDLSSEEQQLADKLAKIISHSPQSSAKVQAISPFVIIGIIRLVVEILRNWKKA